MSAIRGMKSINPMGVMDGLVSYMGFTQIHYFLNSILWREIWQIILQPWFTRVEVQLWH